MDRIGETVDPFNKQPVAVPLSGNLELSGFAFDEAANAPAAEIDVVIDGLPFIAHYGLDRADVATYFKNPTLTKTGFTFSTASRLFGAGKHQVSVRVIYSDKKTYQEGPPVTVEVR